MIEDNLEPDQRIRLEAVAQANNRLGPMLGRDGISAIAELLEGAEQIATYITGGKLPQRSTTAT